MSGALRPYRPWTPYAFLFPACLILGVFVVLSMIQVIIYSFTDYNVFRGAEWVGLDNYERLTYDGTFRRAVFNSFLYLLVTPALMSVSLAAAMVVHSALRGMSWLRLALFLPVVTPTIVAAIAFRLLLNEDAGLINAALVSVGLDRVGWLSVPPWTLVSAMMVTLWKGFGYYMMIFLAGLMAVPRELEEAASIDGAGRLGVFFNVTLPALKPVIVLVAIISSVSALKVFDELYITIRGVPMDQQTAVPMIYDTAFVRGELGMACAQGVVLFVVVLVFSIVQLKVSRDA